MTDITAKVAQSFEAPHQMPKPLPAGYVEWLYGKAFDPSEPRDERGRWEGDGGDSGDGGGKGDGHPGKGYSASAYVKDGVIHTNSVYDAQRALNENRKVELNQPKSVSILIQRLGEVSKKMIADGKKAPNFNLCNVSIKGTNLFCADNVGLTRIEMPQLDKQQTKDFQKYLKAEGYKVKKDKEHAANLRATQNELIGAKVAEGAQKIEANGGKVKPIIISKDDYVLDGHHAWAAKLGLDAADNKLKNDTKMNVVRVNIKITKLLEEADKFTGGKGRKGADEKNFVSFGEVFRDWNESEPRDEQGRWTAGGGGGDSSPGYEFVSPNVGELKFEGAVKELGSDRQGVLNAATEDINDKLGINAQHYDVIGAWKDGAENSTMAVTGDSDWEKMKLSVSMKGWVADQKSVLVFQQNDKDNSVLAQFEAQGNLTEIHEALLADGIENHTLVPTATGATVYVADLENTQKAAIEKAAERYDSNVEVHFGRGEFVGAPWDFQGSDRETRDAARGVYEANIEQSPVPGSKEIWQGVHDRWGKALAESDTSLTARKVYVRPTILKAFEALTAAMASGMEIVAYCGEYIPGTDLIDLAEWEERTVDYIQDPVTGHLMGSHGSGDSDKDGGDKEPAKPEPSPEVMAVGGDEWNKQTAERLEKEYVEAEPALEKIISDAVAAETKVEDPEDVPEEVDDPPFVPDEWGSLTDDQQEEIFTDWKGQTESSYMDSEIESWAESNKLDDAASELAWKFEKGESQEWAVDGIDEARTVLEDQKIPFTNAQLLEAMTVKFDGGWSNIEKGLDISFDDSKLKPIGWDDTPTLPGIEPKKPEDALTKEMRDTLIAEMTTTFEKAAEDLDIEPPEYLKESVEEYQDQHWSDMNDKEKFAWAESHSDTMKYLQEEYDKFYGKGDKPVEANAPFVMPKKLDPLQEEGGKNYAGTQKVARLLSVERAAQLMVARGLYPDDHLGMEPVDFVNAKEWEKWSNDQKLQLARTDAKQMDSSLWTGWKGSSSSYEGQTLQKATAEELGGRLNPMMVSDHAQITKVAEMLATNAAPGRAWDAVKAYVRGKWETSQYLLKKAGTDTVNVYRSVDMPDAAKPVVTDNTDRPNGTASVKTVKIFDTENEAELHREHQAAEYGNDYTSNISNVHNVYQLNSTHNFSDLDKANAFAKKYETDPDNPEQHKEEVAGTSSIPDKYSSAPPPKFTRLPDIHIDRNGAASTTTASTVANAWDGSPGRVVLRASVPRTAVVSVPAYGINIVGEHEVVVAGTAWKGWDAWKGKAPLHEQVKIGHQIVGHPDA